MCGIVGFVGSGDRRDLVAMTDALIHRGPDGVGLFVDDHNRVFLGHRRLAILDRPGGSQPMWNEDGTIGVVFNGEIYNHAELRLELTARGHRFHSGHSDTEVLVHGYEEWGNELPERLNGMFAFAIHDKPRRRLFLARDRFGEKPLFYTQQKSFFGFASELTAFFGHAGFSGTIDSVAVQKLFAYGFIPSPTTFYSECHSLPGGCFLIHDLGSKTLRIERYWNFTLEPDHGLSERDEPKLAEELLALLSQAVQRRLISDVPLGIFLSGGVDSSAVLACAAQHRGAERLSSFTIGFTERSFDESAYAQMVATAFDTQHHMARLDLRHAQTLVPQILGRLDQPLGDPSIIPTYLLSRFAREHVTVALSGDGGDELFAGYDPIHALAPATLYQRLVPNIMHRGVRKMAGRLPVSTRNMSLDFKINRSLMGLSYPPELWNPVWLAPIDPSLAHHLFDHPLPIEQIYDEAITLWNQGSGRTILDKTLEFYTRLYLQDDILVKADRASMMNGLESRAVFLDNDVVDFCRKLPNKFKYKSGKRKFLLRKALEQSLPKQIIGRKKKGFGIPLAKWLREIDFQDPCDGPGGIRSSYIKQCIARHRSGQEDHRFVLWNWLGVQARLDGAAPPIKTGELSHGLAQGGRDGVVAEATLEELLVPQNVK